MHWLEQRIDFYTAQSPDIDRFILPGGTPAASMVHVARTIARRAERIIVRLNWTAKINEEVLILPIVYQIILCVGSLFKCSSTTT